MTEAKQTIDYATISMLDTVSYQGVDEFGMHFDHTTYKSSSEFRWGQLPKNTPVIDLRWNEHRLVWDCYVKADYKTPAAKVDGCRSAGIPIGTAGGLAIIEHQR